MKDLVLKLNQHLTDPLTVGLNGHTKGSAILKQDYVDLHQFLPRTHQEGPLMKIDLEAQEFTPAQEAYLQSAAVKTHLEIDVAQPLPYGQKYVVFDELVRLRFQLKPAEEFDDQRYELIPDENYANADRELRILVEKHQKDTKALVAINSFVGYLFHLAAVDMPELVPDLRPPDDGLKNPALFGRLPRAAIKARIESKISAYPGSKEDKHTLARVRYWVTECISNKNERIEKVGELTSDINESVSTYLNDGRGLDKAVTDFLKV